MFVVNFKSKYSVIIQFIMDFKIIVIFVFLLVTKVFFCNSEFHFLPSRFMAIKILKNWEYSVHFTQKHYLIHSEINFCLVAFHLVILVHQIISNQFISQMKAKIAIRGMQKRSRSQHNTHSDLEGEKFVILSIYNSLNNSKLQLIFLIKSFHLFRKFVIPHSFRHFRFGLQRNFIFL